MTVNVGGKKLGAGHPCFITFEAGPTHCGLDSALRLVRYAANSGADAIKFQILDPERLMADRSVMFSYGVLADRNTGEIHNVTEPLYELMKRRALQRDEWMAIKRECEQLGILFFATVGYPDEVDLLVEMQAASIKIASADIDHIPLIRYAAATGLPIQLDTGNGNLGEVERAVDVIRASGNHSIIIHHCPSGYPARMDGVNLRVLSTLKQMFPYPIAFSDHSPGWAMDLVAIALGADMIEKTITEDSTTPSVEHCMSLEPEEMIRCVKDLRDMEVAMGQSRRILTDQDREKRKSVRRSLYLAEDAAKGARLGNVRVEYRRPGYGLGPDMMDVFADARLNRNLTNGHMLVLEDLEF